MDSGEPIVKPALHGTVFYLPNSAIIEKAGIADKYEEKGNKENGKKHRVTQTNEVKSLHNSVHIASGSAGVTASGSSGRGR